MAQYVFKRKEKKYKLSRQQMEAFLSVLEKYMIKDKYGVHTIRNLYLDTEDYALIRRSMEKPIYKEKIRLRGYGEPDADSRVFLELKKKYKGVVYKRRVKMSLNEAEEYLESRKTEHKDTQVMKEIEYFMDYYQSPTPKAYVAYERVAYFSEEDDNLRVTFDTDIRGRFVSLTLDCDAGCEEILPKGYCIMEIKTVGAMPAWMVETLSKLKIYPSSFSKYGTLYQKYKCKDGGQI